MFLVGLIETSFKSLELYVVEQHKVVHNCWYMERNVLFPNVILQIKIYCKWYTTCICTSHF